MRISCFGNVPHRLRAPFCKGELRSPLASRPGVVAKDPQLAYMVDDTGVTTSQPAVPKCKKVRFFTFGLERLEQEPGSTKNSYGLTNLFKTFRQKGKSFEFNLADPKHEDILLDCLRANFPQLFENIPDKRIIFLDCRATGDPAIDKSTHDHVGWFPFNLENMVRQEQWTKWWKEIHERSTGPSRRKRRSMCSLSAKVDAIDRSPTSASCKDRTKWLHALRLINHNLTGDQGGKPAKDSESHLLSRPYVCAGVSTEPSAKVNAQELALQRLQSQDFSFKALQVRGRGLWCPAMGHQPPQPVRETQLRRRLR